MVSENDKGNLIDTRLILRIAAVICERFGPSSQMDPSRPSRDLSGRYRKTLNSAPAFESVKMRRDLK